MDNSKSLWEQGPVFGVRKLIKISIADRQQETGGPIHILRLTKDCAEWIDPRPECEGGEKPCPSPAVLKPESPSMVKPWIPIPILSNYLASELFALLKWWLDAGMPYTPESMDEIFHRLINPCFKSALRIADAKTRHLKGKLDVLY